MTYATSYPTTSHTATANQIRQNNPREMTNMDEAQQIPISDLSPIPTTSPPRYQDSDISFGKSTPDKPPTNGNGDSTTVETPKSDSGDE